VLVSFVEDRKFVTMESVHDPVHHPMTGLVHQIVTVEDLKSVPMVLAVDRVLEVPEAVVLLDHRMVDVHQMEIVEVLKFVPMVHVDDL